MNEIELFKEQRLELEKLSLEGLEGYRIDKLLVDDISLYICFGIGNYSFLKMVLRILFDEFKYDFRTKKNTEGIIYNSYTYQYRLDYKYSSKKISEILPNSEEIFEERKISFNKRIFVSLYLVICWNKKIKKIKTIPRTERYFLLKKLLNCWKLSRVLSKYDFNRIKYCVLQFDAIDTENLLSQYLQRNNIVTFTLQHGHFHHTEFIDNGVFHISPPYEGFVSNYFLAWGDYSKFEAIANGIEENKIIEVGALKRKPKSTVIKHNHFNVFSLVLNGTLGNNENIKLLEIANNIYEKYNIKFIVRPHPSAKENDYIYSQCKGFIGFSHSNEETIEEMASRVDFSICGNSTVFTELLQINSIAFSMRPTQSIDTYTLIDRIRFSDIKELCILIDIYRNNPSELDRIICEERKKIFCTNEIEVSYSKAINERLEGKRLCLN